MLYRELWYGKSVTRQLNALKEKVSRMYNVLSGVPVRNESVPACP